MQMQPPSLAPVKRGDEERSQTLMLRFPTHVQFLDLLTSEESVRVKTPGSEAEEIVKKHRHELVGASVDAALSRGIANVKKSYYNTKDGTKLLVIRSDDTVEVTDLAGSAAPRTFPSLGKVTTASLSPRGTYMTIWQKTEGRLVIVEVASGEDRFELSSKSQTTANTIQWTEDESLVAHLVTNEVRVLSTTASRAEGGKFSVVQRVRAEGVTHFSLDPYHQSSGPDAEDGKTPIAVATFQPSKQGKPIFITLWLGEKRACSASTFRADECTFRWAPPPPVFGASSSPPAASRARSFCLAKTDSTVDATGQSYYGESRLFLLRSDASDSVAVVPPKEGSMHDVKWSPRGDSFCVVAGRSPPRSTLFSDRGEPLFEFGEAHRNTAAFSPHGRFLVLAGFGNLAGEMDFWDVYKRKRLGFNVADAAVGYAWSPSGRVFMTATLAPRMNVDNGIGLYTYRGSLVGTWRSTDAVLGGKGESALLDAQWRPAEGWPDEPKSPSLPGEEEAEAAKANARLAALKKPVGVYRPKGASGASAIAEAMKGERAKPGALGEAKKAVAVVSNIGAGGDGVKKPAGKPSTTPAAAPPSSFASPTTREEAEKRIHKLNKLLRDIEAVEKKREEGGQSALNEDQLKKLERKPVVAGEIAFLTKAMGSLTV